MKKDIGKMICKGAVSLVKSSFCVMVLSLTSESTNIQQLRHFS